MNDLLNLAYKAMDDKLASDLITIDFRNNSPFLDYFIIGSARNYRHARSIIENVEEIAIENGFEIKKAYTNDTSKWLLIDLGNIVCHVFYDGEREIYNLEGLWKDLPTIKM